MTELVTFLVEVSYPAFDEHEDGAEAGREE